MTPLMHACMKDFVADLATWPCPRAAEAAIPFIDADREKVAPHVFRKLELGGLVDEEWRQRRDRMLAKRAILEEEAIELAEVIASSRARYVFMRGFAVQASYPAEYMRQFNDLDIAIATEDELERVLARLDRRGYYSSRPPVIRRDLEQASRRWIVMPLNRRHRELEEPIMLDLYLGGPSITRHTHYLFPQRVFERPSWVRVRGRSLAVPDATHIFLGALAECYERDHLLARDLLDLQSIGVFDLDTAHVAREVVRLRMGAKVAEVAAVARSVGLVPLSGLLTRLAGRFPRVLGHLWPRLVRESWRHAPIRAANAALAGPIDYLEDRFPGPALAFYRRVPPQLAFDLGLPIYLFNVGNEPAPPASRFQVCARTYLARCRPVLSEEEADASSRAI
jgi:hypothetical protein